MVDKILGIVIIIQKDSKTLQVVIPKMTKGVEKVTRINSRDSITVKYLNDMIKYQKHMGGVDCGDHHRLMGAGFASVVHFKKWYKKSFLGLTKFSLLQGFTA